MELEDYEPSTSGSSGQHSNDSELQFHNPDFCLTIFMVTQLFLFGKWISFRHFFEAGTGFEPVVSLWEAWGYEPHEIGQTSRPCIYFLKQKTLNFLSPGFCYLSSLFWSYFLTKAVLANCSINELDFLLNDLDTIVIESNIVLISLFINSRKNIFLLHLLMQIYIDKYYYATLIFKILIRIL